MTAESTYTIVSVSGCRGLWTGANPYATGAITGACTVEASFTLNSYSIDTIALAEQGSISPSFRHGVVHGDTTEFDIFPESTYKVATVSGCSGTWTGSNPYITDEITADCTVEATFVKNDGCYFFIIPTSNGSQATICL